MKRDNILKNGEAGMIEKLLEKHRSNTGKYLHLLNQPVKDKPSNPQDTLTRIESKFGIALTKRTSEEEEKRLGDSTRVGTDEKTIQD